MYCLNFLFLWFHFYTILHNTLPHILQPPFVSYCMCHIFFISVIDIVTFYPHNISFSLKSYILIVSEPIYCFPSVCIFARPASDSSNSFAEFLDSILKLVRPTLIIINNYKTCFIIIKSMIIMCIKFISHCHWRAFYSSFVYYVICVCVCARALERSQAGVHMWNIISTYLATTNYSRDHGRM